MKWNTPSLVEICIGLEINGYLVPRGGERCPAGAYGSYRCCGPLPALPAKPSACQGRDPHLRSKML
jgi:coenzyme PQQ precursor peptide PqqA